MADLMEFPNFNELLGELDRGVERIHEIDRDVSTELETLTREFSTWCDYMAESYEQHGVKAASMCAMEEENDRLAKEKLRVVEQECSNNDLEEREYRSELTEMGGSITVFEKRKSAVVEGCESLNIEINAAMERSKLRSEKIEQTRRNNKVVEDKLKDEYRMFRKATGMHVEASADTTLRFHFFHVVRDRSDIACYVDIEASKRYRAKGCEPMVPAYDELARELIVSEGNIDALRVFLICIRKAFQQFYNQ